MNLEPSSKSVRPPVNQAEPRRADCTFELPEIAKLRRRKLDRIRRRIDAWQHDRGIG